MQTVKYFNLVGDEEDIGNERFKWSRASTFSYNRNAIELVVAYASAIRTHLLVHGTAHPTSTASVRPRSAADSLIRSAVDISDPRQQGNPPARSSAISSSVRSDIILGAGTVGGGGFDCVNEEANVRANATVIDGHADVRASAVMTEANDDGANVGNLYDILIDILGASSRVATPLDLDLAFSAVDVTDGLLCNSLLSPLCHLPPPIASFPSSAAAGEPI